MSLIPAFNDWDCGSLICEIGFSLINGCTPSTANQCDFHLTPASPPTVALAGVVCAFFKKVAKSISSSFK